MATVEKACTCKSDFQDKTYGKGVRVFNTTEKESIRCTVCGREERTISNKQKK